MLSSKAFGQMIYLHTNLSGHYRITCNDESQEFIEVDSLNYKRIKSCENLEIQYTDNDATIIYLLSDLIFSENDTLSLEFIHYYRADTLYHSSGCLDGTNSNNHHEVQELNKNCKTIEELPNEIKIQLNCTEIILFKKEEEFISFSNGSGLKAGRKWGFTSTKRCKLVKYISIPKTK